MNSELGKAKTVEIPDVFFGGESLQHQQKERDDFLENFWVLEHLLFITSNYHLLWIVAAPPSMEAGFSHGVGIDTLFATPPKKSSKMKTLQFHQTPPLSSHFIAV